MTALDNNGSHSSDGTCKDKTIHQYPCTQLKDAEECSLKSEIFACVVISVCILGLIGNGIVFWLLGFRIKRNFFSIYVWNLAIADFGVLAATCSLFVCVWSSPSANPAASKAYKYLIYLVFFVQYSSIQFLTAISVDRCLVILFPIWHRCRRPKNLSTIVSSVLWGVSCVLLVLLIFFSCWDATHKTVIIFFILFFSVMLISTGILFFKVCCNARFRQHGKVHVAILLSLLFFIVTTVPISLFVKLDKKRGHISAVTLFFSCLNSSINPVIYFIAGRYQSLGKSKTSIKDMLRKLFKEEESSGVEESSLNLNPALKATSDKNRPPGSELSTRAGSCPPGPRMEEFYIT